MLIRKTALSAVLIFYALPTLAQNHSPQPAAKPRPITSVSVGDRTVELLAVSQRARADNAVRKSYLRECRAYSRVMPGYPQPAFVSLDLRVKF